VPNRWVPIEAGSLSELRYVLRKLRARTRAERLLLAEAFAWLAIARAATLLMPFRHTVRALRLTGGESTVPVAADGQRRAAQVGWAVGTAAGYTPWRSLCLAQAFAGTAMLRRRHLPSTLYLGMAQGDTAPAGLAAHAWVRCGDEIVTGADEQARFTAVGSFSSR
jgi:hypothetical protein